MTCVVDLLDGRLRDADPPWFSSPSPFCRPAIAFAQSDSCHSASGQRRGHSQRTSMRDGDRATLFRVDARTSFHRRRERTSKIHRPFLIEGSPPTSVATVGVPTAIASCMAVQQFSMKVGTTATAAHCNPANLLGIQRTQPVERVAYTQSYDSCGSATLHSRPAEAHFAGEPPLSAAEHWECGVSVGSTPESRHAGPYRERDTPPSRTHSLRSVVPMRRTRRKLSAILGRLESEKPPG